MVDLLGLGSCPSRFADLVANCPQNYTDLDVIEKCERGPMAMISSDYLWYRNIHCARCNGVDDQFNCTCITIPYGNVKVQSMDGEYTMYVNAMYV